ncbi:MAG: calcineurin-like phosphoesterase, partial [Pygmaiobacter massiliensis]
MIYVTADLHGDVDRLRSLPVKLGRKDTLIVLGDFGFLWDGSKAEKKMLKWLGKRRYQLLFLDGAHENYDLL